MFLRGTGYKIPSSLRPSGRQFANALEDLWWCADRRVPFFLGIGDAGGGFVQNGPNSQSTESQEDAIRDWPREYIWAATSRSLMPNPSQALGLLVHNLYFSTLGLGIKSRFVDVLCLRFPIAPITHATAHTERGPRQRSEHSQILRTRKSRPQEPPSLMSDVHSHFEGLKVGFYREEMT